MVTLLIGADICPIGCNRPKFEQREAGQLFRDLLPELRGADLAIVNLECPLIERRTPVSKTGPTFGESSTCINGITAAGIDVLCLANNHIMDHGANGLENTIKVCSEAGIATVGAGRTLQEARKILVQTINGIRVGILAAAEHEFSIAANGSSGANPLDPVDFVRNVKSRRKEFDYLVVLLHGGDEFHVPSPRIKDTCRFMIEMGANAVIVQHPHCLGGYEDYHGGHIVYGQGALLMDEPIYRDLKSFHEGYLVKLSIARDYSSSMDIIPFLQSVSGPGARKLTGTEEVEFRRMLREKSDRVKDDALVEADWVQFCEKHKHAYMSCLLGHNKLLARLNGRGLLERFLHGKRPLLGARNVVCCETHREALETIFNHGLI